MDENKKEQVQIEKAQLECKLQQAKLKVKELYPYFIEYCNQMQLKKQLKQQLQLYNSRLQSLQTNTSQLIPKDDLKELPIKKQKLTSKKSISQAQILLAKDMKEQKEKRKVRETYQQNGKQTNQSVTTQKNQNQENKKIIIQTEQPQSIKKPTQNREQEKDISSILVIQEASKTLLEIQEKTKAQEIPQIVKSFSASDQQQIPQLPQLPAIRRNKSLEKNQSLEEILQMDADELVEVKIKKLNQILTKLQENKVQEELKALNKENIIILFSKIQNLIQTFLDLYNSNQITKIPLDIYGLYILFKYLKQTKGLSEQMKICKQSIIKLCKIYEDYIPEKILDVKKEGKTYIFKVKWFGFKGEDTWEPQRVLPDKEMLKKKIKEKFG